MIRYSHVSLIVLCDSLVEADAVTKHLGVQPSRVRESKSDSWTKEGGRKENAPFYSWMLDSPKTAENGNPTIRLYALADTIEPFAPRLSSLQTRQPPSVDILYHCTPQHPHGVTGEFDWFSMSSELMRRYGAWNLSVSYEAMWFDHPDWVNPANRSLLRRVWANIWERNGSKQVVKT